MIKDIKTVIWKEWKEVLLQRSGFQRGTGRFKLGSGILILLFLIGMLGIVVPLQMGRRLVELPIALIIYTWVPFVMVMPIVADSFAGERERNTLETLLASRLSDKAILFGKMGAIIGYSWGLTMICLLLGLVSINISHWSGELLIYPTNIFLGAVVLSMLCAGLATILGLFISLRASTVKQAQQTLSILIMIPVFLFSFGPMLIVRFLSKEWKDWLAQVISNANLNIIILIAIIVLIVLNIILLLAAIARFKREKLILY